MPRVLRGRGLYDINFSPVYQFAQMWGRGEKGEMRCKSGQQTSKNGIRLLIRRTNMYENREIDNNDTKTMCPRTENQGSFFKACVSMVNKL